MLFSSKVDDEFKRSFQKFYHRLLGRCVQLTWKNESPLDETLVLK